MGGVRARPRAARRRRGRTATPPAFPAATVRVVNGVRGCSGGSRPAGRLARHDDDYGASFGRRTSSNTNTFIACLRAHAGGDGGETVHGAEGLKPPNPSDRRGAWGVAPCRRPRKAGRDGSSARRRGGHDEEGHEFREVLSRAGEFRESGPSSASRCRRRRGQSGPKAAPVPQVHASRRPKAAETERLASPHGEFRRGGRDGADVGARRCARRRKERYVRSERRKDASSTWAPGTRCWGVSVRSHRSTP